MTFYLLVHVAPHRVGHSALQVLLERHPWCNGDLSEYRCLFTAVLLVPVSVAWSWGKFREGSFQGWEFGRLLGLISWFGAVY